MITTEWRELASCRDADPELFYPIGELWKGPANADRAQVALAVCAACPVRSLCLADALHRGDDWAILGGTMPSERRAPAYVA